VVRRTDLAADVLLNLAERRVERGEVVRARAVLGAFVRHGRHVSHRRALRAGTLMLWSESPAIAVAWFEQLRSRRDVPEHRKWAVEAALGQAMEQAGRTADAVDHLSAAVSGAPQRPVWRRHLLATALRVGEPDGVRSALMIDDLPQRADVSFRRFQDVVVQGEDMLEPGPAATQRSSVTIDALRHAVAPKAASRIEHTATAPIQEGTNEAGRVWYEFGRHLEESGHPALAAAAFEVAVACRPEQRRWQHRLARRRRQIGLQGTELHVPERAVAESPVPPPDGYGVVAPLHAVGVTGWLSPTANVSAPVRIKLNGTVVASTYATKPVTAAGGHQLLEFRRAIQHTWAYVGRGDVIEVEHDGRVLPHLDRGEQYVIDADRVSCSIALLERLDSGFVLNKYGKLKRSIQSDSEWQTGIVDLFHRLRDDVHDKLGLALIPFYGTLLGAVRESNFLGHDNDFDTVCILQQSAPEAVKAQFLELVRVVIECGYDVRARPWHVWVFVPGTRHKLDIFFAWFDEDDRLQVSYGYHGEPIKRSPALLDLKPASLGNHEMLIPSNAEEVLTQLYGPAWRRPDPGFTHHTASRVIHAEYRLTPDERNAIHWEQFYRDHRVQGVSPFAEFVARRFPQTGTMIEFGCGTGRDSLFFASRGWSVLAGDRSIRAIRQADEKRAAAGLDGLRFGVVDASSADDVARFLNDAALETAEADVFVYLRFFLHAVTEGVEDTLISTLVERLRPPFRLCAEFRTAQDAQREKAYDDHDRRYIDEEAFADALTSRWGFEVEHLEARTGLSPYLDEDPHLARVIAFRSGPH